MIQYPGHLSDDLKHCAAVNSSLDPLVDVANLKLREMSILAPMSRRSQRKFFGNINGTMRSAPNARTWTACLPAPGVIGLRMLRYSGCSTRTSKSMGCAKSGSSCNENVAISPAAPSLAYKSDGASRRHSRQTRPYNNQRQDRAVSARPRQSLLQGSRSGQAVVIRFHLYGDLAGLRFRGFRHQCLHSPHRRLAGKPDRPCGFVLDALDWALRDRRPVHRGELIQHSAARNMCQFAIPNDWPRRASSRPSEALATVTINGPYNAEVIHRRGPWRNFEAV